MSTHNEVVFLFDADNMLLDNDRMGNDLRHYIESEFGAGNTEGKMGLTPMDRD